MTAIDGSKTSDKALQYVVKNLMNKDKDDLFLVAVTDKISHKFPSGPAYFANIVEAQKYMEKETEKMLKKYGKMCHEWGVKNVFAVRGTAPHVGELICQATDKKAIDVLVIGRRGLSGVKRLFLGSTSRYCVEHANCSVLVVKEDVEDKKSKNDQQIDQKEKFESSLNRNISRIAEEEERTRLTKEMVEEDKKLNEQRTAEHIGVVIEEEEERRRRILEDRIIDERHFHVEDLPYEALPHIESPHEVVHH